MLRAVIFDMDGVLIDSEPLHARAAVLALKELGVDITIDYCYGFIGSTTEFMLETIIKEFHLIQTVSELEELYQQCKHKLIKLEGYQAIPYTKELIIDLYKHGMKLAIASSSTQREIEDVVKALGLKKYFHKLISGTTVEHPKPSPDVFIKAMKELGVNKKECIIIEDSFNGVTASKAAGIPCIGFLNKNSGNQDLSEACILIEGFEEVNHKFITDVFLRAHNKPVTIATTNRLIIRELTIEDIPGIYQIYQNPKVKQYISDIDEYLADEIEKHKAYIKNVYNFYGYGLWGVFSKEDNTLIGRCGIQNTMLDGQEEIELGYILDYNHWGFGYAYECITTVLDYAFHVLRMNRIVAVIHPMNLRSIKVAERAGLKKEKMIKKGEIEYFLYKIMNSEK